MTEERWASQAFSAVKVNGIDEKIICLSKKEVKAGILTKLNKALIERLKSAQNIHLLAKKPEANSKVLVNQSGTITYRLSRLSIPPHTLPINRRILRRKPKALSSRPIISLIIRISPAHRIAYAIRARLYLRPIIHIVNRTLIYALVQRLGHTTNYIRDAIDI